MICLKHNDKIVAFETSDNEKPYEQAPKVEVSLMIHLMRYYAGWEDKTYGFTSLVSGVHQMPILHEPINVSGQIIPWDFLLLMKSMDNDKVTNFLFPIQSDADILARAKMCLKTLFIYDCTSGNHPKHRVLLLDLTYML